MGKTMKIFDMTSLWGMIRTTIWLILLILALGMVSGSDLGHAANHYIWSGATGSNDGSDWENAWTDIPEDAWDYAQLVRGDNYYVADGTYTGTKIYTVKVSGSLPDYINIYHATAATCSSVTGWDDSLGDGQAVFTSVFTIDASNVRIDGVTGSDDSGHGIKIDYSSDETTNQIMGVYATADSNIIISHAEIEMSGYMPGRSQQADCLYLYKSGGTNYDISYCYLHDASRCGILHSLVLNCTIEHCLFEDIGNGQSIHHEAISACAPANANLIIRYNTFENVIGSSYGTGVIVIKDNPSSSYCYIYGNIVDQSSSSYTLGNGVVCNTASGGDDDNDYMFVYNNTFYGLTGSSSIYWYQGDNNECENNVWYDCTNTPVFTGTSHDYNACENSLSETHGVTLTEIPFTNAGAGNFHPTTDAEILDVANTSIDSTYLTDANDVYGNKMGALSLSESESGEYTDIVLSTVSNPPDSVADIPELEENLTDSTNVYVDSLTFEGKLDIDYDYVVLTKILGVSTWGTVEAFESVSDFTHEEGESVDTVSTHDDFMIQSTDYWSINSTEYGGEDCIGSVYSGNHYHVGHLFVLPADPDSLKVMVYGNFSRSGRNKLIKMERADQARTDGAAAVNEDISDSLTTASTTWDFSLTANSWSTSPDFKGDSFDEVDGLYALTEGDTIGVYVVNNGDSDTELWNALEEGESVAAKIIVYSSGGGGGTGDLCYKDIGYVPQWVKLNGEFVTIESDSANVTARESVSLDGTTLFVACADSDSVEVSTEYAIENTGSGNYIEKLIIKYAGITDNTGTLDGERVVVESTTVAISDSGGTLTNLTLTNIDSLNGYWTLVDCIVDVAEYIGDNITASGTVFNNCAFETPENNYTTSLTMAEDYTLTSLEYLYEDKGAVEYEYVGATTSASVNSSKAESKIDVTIDDVIGDIIR